MRKSTVFAASILALACAASPSAAVNVSTTFSGFIVDSSDLSGLLGVPGGNIDGQTFELTIYTLTGSSRSSVNGGSFFDRPNVAIADIKINGVDQGFNSDSPTNEIGVYDNSIHFAVTKTYGQVGNVFSGFGLEMLLDFASGGNGKVSNTFAGLIPTLFTGSFDYSAYDTVLEASTIATHGSFLVTRYNGVDLVSPVGGVPEPATWALMIGGLGLVGVSTRRRRRTAAVLS